MKFFTFSIEKTSLISRACHRVVLAISFFLLALTGYAQENPLFSQYMFNGLVINPAYTGSNEALTLGYSLITGNPLYYFTCAVDRP